MEYNFIYNPEKMVNEVFRKTMMAAEVDFEMLQDGTFRLPEDVSDEKLKSIQVELKGFGIKVQTRENRDIVEEIKIYKDSLVDLEEEVSNKYAENQARLTKLRQELEDNKIRTLNEAATSIGKVIIAQDELDELKGQVEKMKAQHKEALSQARDEIDEKVKLQVEQKINVLRLEHECRTAELSASNKNYEREIVNMEKTLKRMQEELNSQKELTANIAQAGRPNITNSGKCE